MSQTPKGNYKARLADMKFGQSTNGKDVMEYIIDVQVSTSDIRRKSIATYFSGGATQYTEERLAILGFNGDFENPAVAAKWYGDDYPLEVYCDYQQYDDGKGGGPRDVEKWGFSRGSSAKPATDDAKAAMSQRWRAKYGSAPASTPPATKPSTPPPAAAPKGPPPPVEPAGDVWTKDRAWAHYDAEFEGKVNADHWTKVVQQVGEGRHERTFTSDDWKKVAETVCIPF